MRCVAACVLARQPQPLFAHGSPAAQMTPASVASSITSSHADDAETVSAMRHKAAYVLSCIGQQKEEEGARQECVWEGLNLEELRLGHG